MRRVARVGTAGLQDVFEERSRAISQEEGAKRGNRKGQPQLVSADAPTRSTFARVASAQRARARSFKALYNEIGLGNIDLPVSSDALATNV